MKKLIFFLSLLLINGILNAQSFSGSTNFWNTISVDNPAMSALGNRTEANLNLNALFKWNTYKGGLIFNQKVRQLRGAIGINTLVGHNSLFSSNRTMFNYNYQLQIKPNHTVSFGAGAGYAFQQFDKNFYDNFELNKNFSRSQTFGSGSAGVAYHNRKLSVGIGYNVIGFEAFRPYSSVNLFAEYRQAIGEKFSISPKVFYRRHQNDFQDLNVALVGEFRQRFNFGIGTRNTTNPYLLIGYKLRSGLSFNYTYVGSRSKLNNKEINILQHELNLRFTLPNR
jgi:hypothetical protein